MQDTYSTVTTETAEVPVHAASLAMGPYQRDERGRDPSTNTVESVWHVKITRAVS